MSSAFQTMAVSEDGLIEGIYMLSKRFIVGVQWHPEFSFDTDENSRKLVNDFVLSINNTGTEADNKNEEMAKSVILGI